jgi:hypothetical protein
VGRSLGDAVGLSCFPGLSAGVRDADFGIAPRVTDLAHTFPLLFFMLATDSGSFGRRVEVLRLVDLGKPLPEVAAAYGLPLCFRRIAPQACREPLPWVAWSKDVAPILGNYIPEAASDAANWLAAVFYAARFCNERFALWVARQAQLFAGSKFDATLLRPLALYAWHSVRADNPLANITVAPWSPEFGLGRVLVEAELWIARLWFFLQSGQYPIVDTWLKAGRVGEFEIVPIVTWDGLMAERVALRNCLHRYADRVASGACRVFAVKENGTSVAALEITGGPSGPLALAQLKGPGNGQPSPAIQSAVRSWFKEQTKHEPPVAHRAAPRLAELIAPYYAGIGAAGAGANVTLSTLRSQLNQLRERLAEVKRLEQRATDGETSRVAGDGQLTIAADRVRRALRARLGDSIYSSWFETLEFHAFEAGIVRVSTPVSFLRRRIESHYFDDLIRCCAVQWPEVTDVEIMLRAPRYSGRPTQGEARGAASSCDAGAGGTRSERVPIQTILAIVSRHYAVAQSDILSERRHRCVVRPRQIAMYLAFSLSACGIAEIGRRLGGRDSTTVLHAIRKIRRQQETDPRLRREIEELRALLTTARP